VTRRVAAIVEQSWHRVPGGTATSTVRTLDAIASAGRYEVVGVAARHREPAPVFAAPTVPVVHMALGRRSLYEAWHRFRRPLLQPRTGTVDIVHATGGVVPPAGDAALVVTIHDLAFLHRPDHFTRRGVSFMTRGFELAKTGAERVIVPSEATAVDCEGHGLHRDRIDVVPWGARPVEVADADRDRVRAAHHLPSEFVLWVGAAEPRKNLAGLIEAVGRSSTGISLVLAGTPGWGVDVAQLMASSGGRARHIGQVTAPDLAVLYDLCTVFVYPSLREGFGMPVLEAMAQGAAVITSTDTATAEVVGENGITVDPTDHEALGDAIDALLLDDGERARVGRSGRDRATTMTWERTAAATEAAYERALG
jgi:glycosyltransferase involved in cell wall biosynthesis